MRARSLLLAVVLALAASPACGTFGGNTKVDHGQLYQSGDSNYDPYFQQIHQAQVAAQAWPDEKKSARKSLASALAARPEASDETLVHETRKRAKAGALDGAMTSAVDETKRAETDRAARLKAAAAKLDQLVKEGKELQGEERKDFEGRGADRADEKKEAHHRELRRELDAAVDNATSLLKLAKSNAKDAEEFVTDLSVASGREGVPAPTPPVEKPAAPPPTAEAKKDPSPPPPPPKPTAVTTKKPKETKPAEDKPDKPAKPDKPDKPAPKPPDEVFNP